MKRHVLVRIIAGMGSLMLAGNAWALDGRQVFEAGGTGRWPAIGESYAETPAYTIYRPAHWPKTKLPVILWGNGGCRDAGLSARQFLREIASHGYLVIANGSAKIPDPRPANAPPPPPPAVDETRAAGLLESLDWAVSGRELRKRIDGSKVAVMGHSCGGLQALAVGSDPRIDTVILFASGVYNRLGNGLSRVSVAKADLEKIKVPIAYFLGGESDIAFPNGKDDVDRINHVPVFLGSLPVGHGGTFDIANGGDWARAGTAWLDWQLKGDTNAARWFSGTNCRLCTTYGWTITRKNIVEPK